MNHEKTNIQQEMSKIRQRFFVFLDQLEAKLKEFSDAAIPELRKLNNDNEDVYKSAYHRMKAAVMGQLENLRQKAYSVNQEKILGFEYPFSDMDMVRAFNEMRMACYDRYHLFEDRLNQYRTLIDATFSEDLEDQYQRILQEFDTIRKQFNCIKCGAELSIDKIYFTTTYLTCSFCHTQNTFEPSSQAKSLEHLGRSLAEQRTAHLLKASQDANNEAQQAFQAKHRKELDLAFERNPIRRGQLETELESITRQYNEIVDKQVQQYKHYLRSMFDEWNKINPILKEEHERFFQRMLDDYLSTNSKL